MYTVPDGRKREGQFIRITIQVSDIFLILPFGQGHATESSHIGFCGIRIILLRIHGPCPGHTEGKAYAGLKVCRMARGTRTSEWVEARHPRGMKYFWLTGRFVNLEPESTDTDEWALAHGFVSVVPVKIDLTDCALLDKLKGWEAL